MDPRMTSSADTIEQHPNIISKKSGVMRANPHPCVALTGETITTGKKTIFHLEVGNDQWEPTEDELKDLTELFLQAANPAFGQTVVATRAGVTVHAIEVG